MGRGSTTSRQTRRYQSTTSKLGGAGAMALGIFVGLPGLILASSIGAKLTLGIGGLVLAGRGYRGVGRVRNESWTPAVTSITHGVALLTIAITALFLAPPTFANERELSITVSPKHAAVGEQTCFSFQLTGPDGTPVGGAEVVLEGRADRSSDQGQARICTRLEWAGRHFALALKRDYRLSKAMIDVSSRGLQGGNWIYAQYYLAAYGSDGHCNDYAFGESQWGCDGHVNATNDYYKDTPGTANWRQQSGSIWFQLYTRVTESAHYAFSDFEGVCSQQELGSVLRPTGIYRRGSRVPRPWRLSYRRQLRLSRVRNRPRKDGPARWSAAPRSRVPPPVLAARRLQL